jgi:hypothetical protein
MSEAAQQLPYGRTPTWSRRRIVRWAVLPVAAVLVGFAITRYGLTWVQHLRTRELQRRCLNYTPVAGRVVYDNNPAVGPRVSTSYRNAPYAAYQRSYVPPMTVAFMGRRASPAGNERLVTVTLGDVGDGGEPFLQFVFSPQVETPATLFKPAASVGPTGAFSLNRLELFATPGDRLRILEGRPDAADSSHFTIDYVHNGVSGTIDGWLNDDDTVTFGPRAGEFVEQSSTFLRWSPVRGGLPPGVVMGNPAVLDPTTRPVVSRKDDPRFR